MPDPDPIRTERLLLHPIRPGDAPDLYAILRDPAIGEPMGEEPPEGADAVRERIESWIRGPEDGSGERWLNWIARANDGRAVAHVQATISEDSAWLAWIVAVGVQRRGFATEAALGMRDHLSVTGVATFLASIPPGHVASEGVARNLGMTVTDEVVHGERVWRTTA